MLQCTINYRYIRLHHTNEGANASSKEHTKCPRKPNPMLSPCRPSTLPRLLTSSAIFAEKGLAQSKDAYAKMKTAAEDAQKTVEDTFKTAQNGRC